MTLNSGKDPQGRQNTSRPGADAASDAEAAFQKATEFHQKGDIAQAEKLYKRIAERFPSDPKADLAKTLLAGMRKEKINVLWETASFSRENCNTEEAKKLYTVIAQEFPGSQEATSAMREIKIIDEIKLAWDSALNFQAQGGEAKALDLYQRIIDQYAGTPEAGNAALLADIIRQNQLIPKGEAVFSEKHEATTPAKIVAHLLMHKKSSERSSSGVVTETDEEELARKKIDAIWSQAVDLSESGHHDAAAVLFEQIIRESRAGHRVRDAKYRLAKIEETHQKNFVLSPISRAGGGGAALWRRHRAPILIAICLLGVIIAGSALYILAFKPANWTDTVQKAKKAVVLVKTANGTATGFFATADGLIYTASGVIGKNKNAEIRLHSGESKWANVIKAGVQPLDVAILKIDGITAQPFLTLVNADECREGEEIRAIGSAPSGGEYFVTKGIVSLCNQDRDGVRYIQTDASVGVGTSGGPCLNISGTVIGLATSVKLREDSLSLNLVLPISVVKDFSDGRLSSLEESLIRKEQERAQARDQQNANFYKDVEGITKRLQYVADSEHANYLARIDELIRTNRITYDQGKMMVESVKYDPSGSNTIPQWVQVLSLRVSKKEITEEDAANLIRNQFKMR